MLSFYLEVKLNTLPIHNDLFLSAGDSFLKKKPPFNQKFDLLKTQFV